MVFPALLIILAALLAPFLVASWAIWRLGAPLERVVDPAVRCDMATTPMESGAHLRSALGGPLILAGIPGALSLLGLMLSLAVAFLSMFDKGSGEWDIPAVFLVAGGVCVFLPAALSTPIALACILNSAARACLEVREFKSLSSLVGASVWAGGAVFACGLIQFGLSMIAGFLFENDKDGVAPAFSFVLSTVGAIWAALGLLRARWRKLAEAYPVLERV